MEWNGSVYFLSLHRCFPDRILAGLPVAVTPTLLCVDDDDRVVELSAVVVENIVDDVEFECTDVGIAMEVPFDVPDACTDVEVEFELTDVEVPLDVPDACTDVDVALEVPDGKVLDDDDVGIVWLTSESGATG